MKNLALLSLGLLMTSANAAARYIGTWEFSDGETGNVAMNIYGSTFSGTLTKTWPLFAIVPASAMMSGSFTGHRFKMFVTFENGSTSTFQGNVKYLGNHIRMDGLRYFGDSPDVKMRLRMDADWVYR